MQALVQEVYDLEKIDKSTGVFVLFSLSAGHMRPTHCGGLSALLKVHRFKCYSETPRIMLDCLTK